MLLIPAALPLGLWVQRKLGWRDHDRAPEAKEIARHLIVWGLIAEVAGPVSLPAFTHLQFDAFLGRADYADSEQATFRIWPNLLQIKFLDSGDATQAVINWKTSTCEAAEGRGILARIQSPDHVDDSYFLQFETASDGELLQVKVVKLEAPTFGPKLHDLGSYFFARI